MTDEQIARQKSMVVVHRDISPEQIYREVAEIRARDGLPPVEVSPPGLLAMSVSFLAAMRALVADKGRLAPRAVRKARRATCEACPHLDPRIDACRKCGCGSVVKFGLVAKLAIASSECPDDPPRWGSV
jgi:hypothetical protein